MKKLFILLTALIISSLPVYANNLPNSDRILISTDSCETAIAIYNNRDFIDQRLGTPFHIYNSDTYVFPIINDNKIVWFHTSYIDKDGNEKGGTSEPGYEKLNELNDGNVYQIIADEDYNIFAVSTTSEKSVLIQKGIEAGCAGIADEDLTAPEPIQTTGKTINVLNPYSVVIIPDMYTISSDTGSALIKESDFAKICENFAIENINLVDTTTDSYIPVRSNCENNNLIVRYDNNTKNITIYSKY